MGKAASLDTATKPDRKDFDGPFLFCDYWASVLNLKDIVNLESLSVTAFRLRSSGRSLTVLRPGFRS